MQVSYIFRKIRSSKERILKWNRQKKISLKRLRTFLCRIHLIQTVWRSKREKVRQMSFVMRTSKPSVGDKYDICKANGGYSNAILE